MPHAEIAINGHHLPDMLVDAMIRGWWRTPVDPNLLRPFFPAADEQIRTSLYSLHTCASETRALCKWNEPGAAADPPGVAAPGRVDGRDAVAIGDLGLDASIALHYRTRGDAPSVVYLTSRGWFAADAELSDIITSLRAHRTM